MKTTLCLITLLAAKAVFGQEISYFSGPSFHVPVLDDLEAVDMNQGKAAYFIFSGESIITDDVPTSGSSISCFVSGFNGSQVQVTNGDAQIFSDGEVIGDPADWSAQTVLLTANNFNLLAHTNSGWLGPLGAKGHGYLGVKFAEADGTHYGWIQVRLPATNEPALSPLIVDWACETVPQKAILAGQKPVYYQATFNGRNEVPPNQSIYSGSGSFALEGNTLNYNITLDVSFSPTRAGLFGPSKMGVNSSQLIADMGAYSISNFPPFPPFPPPPPSWPVFPIGFQRSGTPAPVEPPPTNALMYTGKVILSNAQLDELLASQLHVNFKSANYPQGELRGEIFPAAPVQFSAILSGHNETHPDASTHHGEGWFTLTGNSLSYEVALDKFAFTSVDIYAPPINFISRFNLISELYTAHGVEIPEGGYPDAPGVPGQVLYSGQIFFRLTDEQVFELKRGEFYLNVLTPRLSRGEIGGHILLNE